jgi:hypothetical protein
MAYIDLARCPTSKGGTLPHFQEWHTAQLPGVENTTKQEIKLLWILCFYFYSETQPIEDERQ